MNWDNYRQEIDEIKIDDTFNARLTQTLQQYQKPFIKQHYILRYASIALVLCLVCIYTIMSQSTMSQQKNEPSKNESDKIAVQDEKKDLPILTYDPTIKGGMGIMATTNLSPDELETNTPWTYQHNLKEIPVYRNAAITDASGGNIIEGGLTDEEIDNKVYYYANLFHLKNHINTNNYPQHNPFYITNYYEEGCISIDRTGDIRIDVHVDENIAKHFRDIPSNKKQAEQRALQFAKLFQKELNLKHPIADVFMDYSSELDENTKVLKVKEPFYIYSVFDKKKDVQEQIESYSFSKVSFYFVDEIPNFSSSYTGPCISIRFNESNIGQEVAKYPVLSVKDAKSMFYAGKYITNSPDPDLNKKIVSIKLVYEIRRDSTYAIPFYRIYAPVALTNLFYPLDKGERYGVYYVPAIPFKYLDIVDAKEAIKFYG